MADCRKYLVKEIFDDYLRCHEYTITQGGVITEGATDVYVAKPHHFRRSLTHYIIDGVTHTFTWFTSGTTEQKQNNRTSNDGTNSQTECIQPRYEVYTAATISNEVVKGMIVAHKVVNKTGVYRDTGGGNYVELEWEEAMPSRVWARRYVQ